MVLLRGNMLSSLYFNTNYSLSANATRQIQSPSKIARFTGRKKDTVDFSTREQPEPPPKTFPHFKYHPPGTDVSDLTGDEKKVNDKFGPWVYRLAHHNPDQGYPHGERPECPFTPKAIKANTLWFATDSNTDITVDEMEKKLRAFLPEFMRMEPNGRGGLIKTSNIGFPNLPHHKGPTVIDAAQERVKLSYLRRGVVIGEFGPHSKAPGAYSSTHRPFRSPMPAYNVRSMVGPDVRFLYDETKYANKPARRMIYLQAYLNQGFKGKDQKYVDQACAKMEDAKKQLLGKKPRDISFLYNPEELKDQPEIRLEFLRAFKELNIQDSRYTKIIDQEFKQAQKQVRASASLWPSSRTTKRVLLTSAALTATAAALAMRHHHASESQKT